MKDDQNIDEEKLEEESVEESTAELNSDSSEIKEEKGSKKGSSKKQNEIEELKQKIEDLEDQLLRSVADYRNQKMRFDEEKRDFVKYANRDLLLRLIPAFDTLFLAEKYTEDKGVRLTAKHLLESLREVGVEKVGTKGKFDAQVMEAVTTGDGEDGMVIEELRPGFTLNGKLVRPAQVKVGKGE